MVSWKLFHCRMASPQRGRGLLLRGIEWSWNHYFKEWSHDGVGRRAFSNVEIPSMRNSEATIISRNGLMTGHEGLFFPCRILECGIVILEALQSCRWEVQEPRRGKEAGENGGGEIWREILCARSLAHSLTRSICGSCVLRNQTCATRHLFSY